MAELSRDTVRLLDRLFNLRGLENVIVRGIEEEIKRNRELTDKEQETQTQNEVAKVDCEGRLSVFETQKGIFENAFAGLDNETFSALRDIDVNIEIGTMLKTIADKSPEFCAGLNAKISDYQLAIDNNKKRIEELRSELSELEDSKKKGMDDRDKLDSLLEQSLSSDEMERESLSTSYVKRILGLFEVFSPDEINVLAKLIMFPDDGLYEYSETYADRVKDGLVDIENDSDLVEEPVAEEINDLALEAPVVEVEDDLSLQEGEPKRSGELESSEEVNVPVEEHQDIVPLVDSSVLNGETSLLDLSSLNRDMDEKASESVGLSLETASIGEDKLEIGQDADEEIVLTSEPSSQSNEELNPFTDKIIPAATSEDQPENDKETNNPEEKDDLSNQNNDKIETFLKSIGLDEANFAAYNNTLNVENVYKLFIDVPEKSIADNYELLRSLDVSIEAVYTCVSVEGGLHTYLVDSELSRKITYLRAKGISEKEIKTLLESSNSALRNSYETVEEKIAAIENSVGKLDDENVGLIETDIVLYDKNCRELSSFGIELEEQELRNNSGILAVSTNVSSDLKVLKNYLISLVRKNGKYAMSPFWKNQYELLTDIDDLIEADLEGLFEYDPEVLGISATEVIKRVKYCLENNISIYDEEDRTSFNDYVVNYMKFNEKFGVTLNDSLESREEVNHKLPSIIGNEGYVEILTGILDEHYRNAEDIVEITLDGETESRFEDLKALLSEKLNAVPSGKYTYKIEGVSISKNKFERHLSVILNALANGEQSLDGVEREILLTALLYNLRQDEETLKKVAESGLGFKVNVKTLGGNNL